jgi:adenine phosphoribosyltransferase
MNAPPDARLSQLHARVRTIADFPTPGVLFRDITPLLADARSLAMSIDLLAERFTGEHVDVVVGIESRGFLFGAPLAVRLNAGFVPARKPGKLPAAVDSVRYRLEYGEGALEMHRDAIAPGARAVVVDDVIATGGTAAAAVELARRQGAEVIAAAFAIELSSLEGRRRLGALPVVALLTY